MNIQFVERRVVLAEADKDYIQEKIDALQKFFRRELSVAFAEVEFEGQGHHQHQSDREKGGAGAITCQILITLSREKLIGTRKGDSTREAFDLAYNTVKLEAERYHKRQTE